MTLRRIALSLLLIVGVGIPAFSVTKDEMEKARAISAKIYLRWANNGSDYLDSKNPSSLSDLESTLKSKEKENIKAFKNIPVPADYESWDKEKLVEYWSKTALATAGLNADGVRSGAKSQIRQQLNKMSVTAPATKAQEAEEAVAAVDTPQSETEEIPQTVEQLTEVAEDSLLAEDSMAVTDSIEAPAKKQSSSTWIYIVALALLVIAVIALVVYASRNMKKGDDDNEDPGPERSRQRPSSPAPASTVSAGQSHSFTVGATAQRESVATPTNIAAEGDAARMREKYAENLALKQEEIRDLTRQLDTVTRQNDAMSEQVETLQQEVDRLRGELGRLQGAPETAAASAVTAASAKTSASTAASRSRQIFLGRVNSRGQFVRADRSLNPGHSIYILDTADGVTGSFRVAEHSSVPEVSFTRPLEMLSGGCVAMDITDTKGKTGIITETPGTAVFEDNIWRVVRKARIRFI
ncbi:MAG: hypothetical protein NC328_05930 [Muribaculum sp.]|nr:hypothetical protein [Muribaculum sp.]